MSDQLENLTDIQSRQPVPDSQLVPGWQVGMVVVGICLTLPGLITGGEAAMNLGLWGAIQAIGLASLILGIMAVPSSIVGSRTRFTSYMILEFVFGTMGAKWVNGLLGLTLLGWFTVTAGFFGSTLAEALSTLYQWNVPVEVLTFVSSILIVFTTIFGFRAIDRMALYAVPLMIIFLIYAVFVALQQKPWAEVASLTGRNPDFFMTAVSAVIGSLIFNVVAMPDLTRYARDDKGAVVAAIGGNAIGNAVSMLVATVPVLVVGMIEPMGWMLALGMSYTAVFVLVFAAWTTNTVNLYSTTLVAATISGRFKDWQLTVGLGLAGTLLAMMGVTDHFIEFLVLLGVVVPPVAGVYLTDYFILNRRDYSLTKLATVGAYGKAPLLAWGVATAAAIAAYVTGVSVSGVEALDGFLGTIPLYLIIDKIWGDK